MPTNTARRASPRVASVKLYRPAHVPKELMPIFTAAASRLASRGKLLDEQGKVDYFAVNDTYVNILSAYSKVGKQASATRPTNGRTASRSPVSRTASWPFRDLTREQLNRFIEQGRWDQVERAARMANRNKS